MRRFDDTMRPVERLSAKRIRARVPAQHTNRAHSLPRASMGVDYGLDEQAELHGKDWQALIHSCDPFGLTQVAAPNITVESGIAGVGGASGLWEIDRDGQHGPAGAKSSSVRLIPKAARRSGLLSTFLRRKAQVQPGECAAADGAAPPAAAAAPPAPSARGGLFKPAISPLSRVLAMSIDRQRFEAEMRAARGSAAPRRRPASRARSAAGRAPRRRTKSRRAATVAKAATAAKATAAKATKARPSRTCGSATRMCSPSSLSGSRSTHRAAAARRAA